MSRDDHGGVSRRGLLRSGAVAGAAAVGGLAGAPPAAARGGGDTGRDSGAGRDTAPAGDLVLYHGTIHPMDGHGGLVSALAVRGGRIVYAGGSRARAVAAVPAGTRQIDLRGRTAVPGIIDCHNHLVLMGNRPGHHTPLENASSIAEVQGTLAGRARGVPAGEFITTIGGFHPNQFSEVRLPTLAELDAALPGHPVYLSVGFAGPSVTNSLGRAFFTTAALPVTVGADGAIAAGTETGKATLALRQRLTFAQRKRSVRDAMAYAVSVGVTTHLDQGAFQATGTPADGAAHEDNYTMHLPFLSVYDDGAGIVRLRINYLHMETDPDTPELAQRLRNAFPFFGNDLVRTGGIGEFFAPVPDSAQDTRWLDAARKVARAGWRAEVHSLTGTDFQFEIQGYETVDAEIGINGLRWVVAHVPRITEEYVNRLKAVGGGVNLTGWQYLAGTGPAAGPPFKMILRTGIPAGMSSDGMQIAPMNPWIHAYYATTGINALGDQINAGQQIGRHELLTLYTRANRWFLGEPDEDQLGTLEVGALGDVVVLDRDYFAVPDADLKKIRSALTVVGGQVVHGSGDLT